MPIPGWNPIFDRLASLRLAVILLILLSILMAVGTVIETRHGASVARQYVYGNWLFNSLMVLLAFNVVFSVLKRWPWRRRHLGFIVTHGGIVVLLIGSLIGRFWGIEGRIQLREGQQTSTLNLDRQVLRVQEPGSGRIYTILPNWYSGPLGGPPWKYRLPEADLNVVVTRRMPHAMPRQRVVERATGEENPAILCRFSVPGGRSLERWMFTAPGENRIDLGPFEMYFEKCSSEEEYREKLVREATGEIQPSLGTIEVTMPGDVVKKIDAEEALEGKPIEIEGTSWKLRAVDYFPDAKVAEGRVVNAGDQPDNPMLRIWMISPQGATEEYLLFAKFPQFSAMHDRGEQSSGAELVFKWPEDTGEADNELRVLQMPDGSLRALLINHGNMEDQPLSVGETVQTPWREVVFEIEEYYRYADIEESWHPAADGQGREVVEVSLESQGQVESIMISRGTHPEPVQVGDRGFLVSYGSQEIDLGFRLKLLDFSNPTYGGTAMAARYQSEVEIISDKLTGGSKKAIIGMNRPLDFMGYRIFQSSFFDAPDGQQVSIFSVARDPQTPVIYLGSILICIGVGLAFYLPKSQKKGERNSR